MPKKKIIKKITKKKKTKKKNILDKKKTSISSNKLSKKQLNPLDLIFKENENKLIALVTKEFDKDMLLKAKTYIKSYSKIEDSIITIDDFLIYIENLDEELFKLFKAYTSSSDQDS